MRSIQYQLVIFGEYLNIWFRTE